MKKTSQTPELLLPAGSPEKFRAAIEGGANAIYLGLRKFNARSRATNFTFAQYISLLNEAKKKNVKVYLTLNTVLKNSELGDMLDMLWFISKTQTAAIIIQDWGLFYLVKKHFPTLEVHASTQMGNHNSAGSNYSKKVGINRIILAREITELELKEISSKTQIELELFIHGALCYSMSGACLFSSFLGGAGANRGLCAQPCRRKFTDNKEKYLFSLKDNQLVEKLPSIVKAGVASLKVEGRMKSAEYVYSTASTYRKVLDNISSPEEAKKELLFDMGRDKMEYFFGGNVKEAFTLNPNSGIYLGQIQKVGESEITIQSNSEISDSFRLRIVNRKTEEQTSLKVKEYKSLGNDLYKVTCETDGVFKGDKVFLIGGIVEKKFSNKVANPSNMPKQEMPVPLRKRLLKEFSIQKTEKRHQLYVRVDSLKWMRKIWLEKLDHLILNLTARELKEFKPDAPFVKKNKHKIWIELPKFIPEGKLSFYKNICKDYAKKGLFNFMISHLSQKEILPPNVNFATNENVYVFNDASSAWIKNERAKQFTYPLENDFGNYYSIRNRTGIVPVYFYPDLFYSRMPVKLENEQDTFVDDGNKKYSKTVRDGMTIVRPEFPVSIMHQRHKFESLGYSSFLIDLSGEGPSKHTFSRLLKSYTFGEQVPNSTTFNYRTELK